jgi:hypothetical protein
VDGDIVAVKLLPKEEWSVPSDIVLQDEEDDPGKDLEKNVTCEGLKEGNLETN